jgi:uncharacterized protein (TIGR03083 family)
MTALAGHMGKVWRWSTRIVKDRLSEPIPADPEPALAPEEAMTWLETSLVDLLDALRCCPDDAPVWGFGPPPRTAAFWQRRQAAETVIHRVDAELARKEEVSVEPHVAADGVGEFVDVIVPRMYRKQPPPPGQFVVIATDTGQRWSDGDPAGGTGTLSGTAEDLLLVLWKRRDDERLTAGGDLSVLAGWRALGSP